MFHATEKQPPISIIFYGKEMRISKDERKAWHSNVKVFFQTNAWVDHNVNMDWAEQVLLKFVESEKYVLVALCDNLEVHQKEEFKGDVANHSELV